MEHIVYIFQKILKNIFNRAAPKIFKLLQFNCENLKNIKTFNFAVSDNQSSKIFYIDNKNFGANSLIKKDLIKE